MSKRKMEIAGLAIVLSFIIILHLTPGLAIRTYVFFGGNPIIALTTGIEDYVHNNPEEKVVMESRNEKLYSLTEPPVERATQGELKNYLVKKFGFFHTVEHYGY
ncbi:hypothetical protein FIU87_04750 [Bacillus sp. THAF10]|uniref:hypothetical protein n=1 Tax=Bacillus sp. THAF10 TaxID=2587848 RepID=UPI001267EF62|nr:hypothetical protein [Bacillus sp. THAF10]QFT87958.1 hypothetical protein FIU87_04750 [Bacillus sp. THAF10]